MQRILDVAATLKLVLTKYILYVSVSSIVRKASEAIVAEDGNGDSEICRLSVVDVKKVAMAEFNVFGTVVRNKNVNW